MEIRPHPGPQQSFLATAADIAIFGGAAGGGKSWALLLEGLRHVMTNPAFAAVYFRRTTVQIKNPGGLWDQSIRLYPLAGGIPYHTLEWKWAKGGKVKFAHLEYETSKLDWHGAEIPLLLFDELPTFTETQFWYLLSRNRSMSGVRAYVRATCNPDADSWVATLIAWWIDQNTGLPIAERSGVIRWFIRVDDRLVWADHAEELTAAYAGSMPKSLTFIGAKLSDNPSLDIGDPGYRANLMAMQLVDRERLLGGNWKIRPAAGLYFRKDWVDTIEVVPVGTKMMRGWDLASTEKVANNDPDFTCGAKIGRTPSGRYIIADATWLQGSPGAVERLIHNTASADSKACEISLPQDPGSAGKAQVSTLVKMLAGFTVRSSTESGQKTTRFSPFSAQAEAGNVSILRGDWNARFLSELEAFPEMKHDDCPDAAARAFNSLTAFNVRIGTGFVSFASREQDGWSVNE